MISRKECTVTDRASSLFVRFVSSRLVTLLMLLGRKDEGERRNVMEMCEARSWRREMGSMGLLWMWERQSKKWRDPLRSCLVGLAWKTDSDQDPIGGQQVTIP